MSTPCCIDRQVTVKSQAWSCGCFCLTSKGTSGLHAKNIREHMESHPSLDISHAALLIPAFPGGAKASYEAAEGLSTAPGRQGQSLLCPHSVLFSSHSKWGRTQLIQPAYASLWPHHQ